MARKRSARAHGPYRHGDRWRVVVVRANGKRDVRSFATEVEARAVLRDALRIVGGSVPVKDAIEQFEVWLKSTGVKAVTVQTSRERLVRALGPYYSTPVSMIVTQGKAIYDRLRVMEIPDVETKRTYSVATQRNTLSVLKRFGGWLVDQGLAKRSPWAGVKPVGKAKRGKPQLRVAESRLLVETCIRELAGGDVMALQPALCILLGLRASEVAGLECRDVDDDGRLVWVAEAKTEAGKRFVEVPAMLRPTLAALAVDESGAIKPGQLIPGANRYSVHWHVKRLCRLAGVPVVSPHGLRGTHATLATSAGATAELVMAALGHTSTEVGRLHYTDPGVAGATKGRRVSDLLGPKKETP